MQNVINVAIFVYINVSQFNFLRCFVSFYLGKQLSTFYEVKFVVSVERI